MRALWISVCVTLIIAVVEAQRNIYVPKPTVSLEKRIRLPTWRRLPEERRKLPIFPKNNKKFVVTQRTTLKNESTTPAMTTKRPLMKKILIKDKTEKDTFTYPPRKPLMEPKRFDVLPISTPKDNTRNFKAKNDEATAEESTLKTVVTSVRTENSVNTFKLNKGNLIQILDSINKATIDSVKYNDQPNKALNKQETKVVQNNDALKAKLPDKAAEESVTEKSVNDKKENDTVTKDEKQVNKTTEKVFLSKQEDKLIQKDVSLNANTHVQGSVEYEYEEVYYDSNEVNATATTANDKASKSIENVFLSKQLNNVGQSNDSLKINLTDNESNKSVTNENDSNVSVVTVSQIRHMEEIESTTQVNTKEELEGRSLDLNDIEIHDQRDHQFLDSSNKHSSEKTGDYLESDGIKMLMKAIVKDTWSDSVSKSSFISNEVKPLVVKIQEQGINEETVRNNPQYFGERPNSHNEVKQVINGKYETKIPTGYNIDASEAFEKKDTQNTQVKSDYIDIINKLEDLNEVPTTSSDTKEFTENSQFPRPDLNIVEEYADTTTLGSDAYASLTESPIENAFDNLKTPSPEEISNEPSSFKTIVIDKSSKDLGAESFQKNEDGISTTFSKIDNSNIEGKVDDEKNDIVNYLHSLAKVIKDKSTVGDDTEVVVDKKPFVSLDMHIVEEYSDKPDINAAEVEGSIQESYLNTIPLTESPIEIIFDSQEALMTEKILFESTFNVTDQSNVINKLISTVDKPVMGDSLKIEDENIGIICAIENLSNEHNEMVNNVSDAIENNSTNLDVTVNYDSNVYDKSDVAITKTQLFNKHVNIVDEDTDKFDTVAIMIDGIINTNETYIERVHEPNTSIEMLIFDHELRNTDKTNAKNNTKDIATNSNISIAGTEFLNPLISIAGDDSNKRDTITAVVDGPFDNLNVYGGHITDTPMTSNGLEMEQLDLMKNLISKIENPVINVTQKVQDENTDTLIGKLVVEQNADDKTNSPSFADIINNGPNIGDNNKETTNGAQLVILHKNIDSEIRDKPKTITIVFDGTTENTSVNSEHIDNDSIGILFDNLEPLGPNKLLPIRSLNEKTGESVTEESSTSDDVISYEATTVKSMNEDISDEWIVISSSASDEMTSNEPVMIKPDNSRGKGLLNEFNKPGKDTSSESINSINLSDEISVESSVIGSPSTLTKEEMSEEMIAEADQSKKFTDEISNESQFVNVTFSSVITNEEISDENLDDKSENLTDEISNQPHVLNKSPTTVNTNEGISDEKMTEKSENLSDEISDESNISNESSSSFVTNEKMSHEMTTKKSENLSDEILNESHVLDESSNSVMTSEEITNVNMTDKYENRTDESIQLQVLNENPPTVRTNEGFSDEITDKSENLTKEIPDEAHIENESTSSLVTNEEIIQSNELTSEKSEYLTDDILNESPVAVTEAYSTDLTAEGLFDVSEQPYNETNEDVSTEPTIDIRHPNNKLASNESFSSSVANEEISDDIIGEKSENLSNEFFDESHVLNESPSSYITNEKTNYEKIIDESENLSDEISNEAHIEDESSSSLEINEEIIQSNELTSEKLEHFTDEVLHESPVTVTEAYITDLTAEGLFDVSEQPYDETNEDVSTEPTIDIRHTSNKLASDEIRINRRKRSNNVIEEENLATTLSGCKYTGHETRLGNDLSFKNINA